MEESEFEIKGEDFSVGGVKQKARKTRKCPFCGNSLATANHGEFFFCRKCHRRMPWIVRNDGDKPVKETVD